MFSPFFILAQFGNTSLPPESWSRDGMWVPISSKEVIADVNEIDKLKAIEHASYICATAINTQIKFSDFTLAEILPNNDKVYRLLIKSPSALGMMMMFEDFKLEKNAKLWLYNKERTHYSGMYSEKDNYQSNGNFLTSYVLGSEVIVEYLEPSQIQTQNFSITKVYHYFRGLKSGNGNGFGAAGFCMINAACPEGNAKPAARDAACRIRVTGSSFSGFCSGTLVGNTSEDKTPYILTANHCSARSNLSDLINWEFDFLYESPACSNPSIEPPAITFKGCTAPAYSGSDNGENSSDFLLLKLNSNLSTSSYDFTFVGWDKSNSNFWGTFCYHHPKGDIKKVSTSADWTSLASYGGNVANTHLSLKWTATSRGHSVTDEGSSGSGLINSDGLLIGTLTGGNALCSNLNGVDFYGRLFMHWDKFGSAANQRLKPWLDPINSGASTVRSVKLSGASASIATSTESVKPTYSFNGSRLNLSWYERGYDVNVYNSLGQKVQAGISNSKDLSLDVSNLVQGLYFIEVQKENCREILKIKF